MAILENPLTCPTFCRYNQIIGGQWTERLVDRVTEASKVWVALPDKLIAQLDSAAEVAGLSRDAALRRAVEVFVDRSTHTRLCDAMAQGYVEMAHLNLAIAVDDEDTLSDWLDDGSRLSEANPRGDL